MDLPRLRLATAQIVAQRGGESLGLVLIGHQRRLIPGPGRGKLDAPLPDRHRPRVPVTVLP